MKNLFRRKAGKQSQAELNERLCNAAADDDPAKCRTFVEQGADEP